MKKVGKAGLDAVTNRSQKLPWQLQNCDKTLLKIISRRKMQLNCFLNFEPCKMSSWYGKICHITFLPEVKYSITLESSLKGFLKNERENAILAAIEEARKNVSWEILFFHLCFTRAMPVSSLGFPHLNMCCFQYPVVDIQSGREASVAMHGNRMGEREGEDTQLSAWSRTRISGLPNNSWSMCYTPIYIL